MFTIQGGRAVIRAAEKAIAKIKETAAQVLRCDVDFLEYDGQHVFLKSDPSVRVAVDKLVRGYICEDGITIGEVVQTTADARLPRYSAPHPETGQGSMGVSYTFGAQGCEIRVDRQTGEIAIEHFASAFDVGRVINPRQIRGCVVGGVLMGIGASLKEELVFDKDGRLLTTNFGKYTIPRVKDMPKRQTVEFVETPEPIGPFGARGIGEHPLVAVAPAILNALHDAIGVDFHTIPITPDKVKKALAKEERQ
jgi:CO/xanthine dehydrogenase Mo-binding subunit